MKKIVAIILAVCILTFTFYGCSKEEDNINFIYPFSGEINSYDPQVASTSDEFMMIENVFEGLIRVNDDGKIQPGVASSWDISSDKLTYTFHLQKGIKWNIDLQKDENGKIDEDSRLEYMGYDFNPDITAKDFVFALQRAVAPQTKCPLYSTVSSIKNATKINSGNMDKSQLGVKAKDDYTLEINLSHPDNNFMTTLSSAVAMPCNKEFFNATKGRYGLSTKYSLFNGQFYVSQILDTSYLLKRNKQYTGPSPSKIKELTFKIVDDSDETHDEIISKLESGYYDAAFINGTDVEKLGKDNNITLSPYCDTTWSFIFNCDDEVLQSQKIRQSFCVGFTRINVDNKDYLQTATNLIPPSCTVDGNKITSKIGKTAYGQNIENSVELYKQGLMMNEIDKAEITVITTTDMEEYVKQMLQGIQSGIGSVTSYGNNNQIDFTLKVQSMTPSQLKSTVASGEYDIAFYPFESTSSSATAFIENFSDNNLTDFDTTKLDNYLSLVKKSSGDEMIKNIKNSENAILNSYSIYPMLYETSYYACANGVSNIQFHPGTGKVGFEYATRQ